MTSDTPLRIALLTVSVVQTGITLYYLRAAGAGANLFRSRQAGFALTASIATSYAGYGGGVIAYLIEPRWMVWAAMAIPLWIRWVGVLLLVVGGAIVIRALHDLGENLTISPSTKDDQQLVTTGAYSWVRHPLYSAVFVESVGVCVVTANWFVSVCAGAFCSLLMYRTRLEEEDLVARFGDAYGAYRRRVGRFLPRRLTGCQE